MSVIAVQILPAAPPRRRARAGGTECILAEMPDGICEIATGTDTTARHGSMAHPNRVHRARAPDNEASRTRMRDTLCLSGYKWIRRRDLRSVRTTVVYGRRTTREPAIFWPLALNSVLLLPNHCLVEQVPQLCTATCPSSGPSQ